jgi:hypothetical protein
MVQIHVLVKQHSQVGKTFSFSKLLIGLQGVTRGYKDGLQPESLADGNWLVKPREKI